MTVRRKRAAPAPAPALAVQAIECANANSSGGIRAFDATVSSSIFVYYPNALVNWTCSFSFCSQLAGVEGKLGRTARLDSDAVFDLLLRFNATPVLPATTRNYSKEAWIGMYGKTSEYPYYYWYDDPTTKSLDKCPVIMPNNLCKACSSPSDIWTDSAYDMAVTVWKDSGSTSIIYDNWWTHSPRRVICECK